MEATCRISSLSVEDPLKIRRATVFYFLTREVNPNFWLLSCVLLLLVFLPLCSCTDTITINSPIHDSQDSVLVSEGKRFQLGFFTPDGSRDSPRRRYIGVWYYGSQPKSVVWVANREPVLDGNGIFQFDENGNLVVSADNGTIWSIHFTSSGNFTRTARLMDSGNLVVTEDDFQNKRSSNVLWQSFVNDTTDTFLPGMLMNQDFNLTSWRGFDDPAKGNFTLERDESGRYVIKNSAYPYWKSETYPDSASSNDKPGKYQDSTFSKQMPKALIDLLSNNIHCENKNNMYGDKSLGSSNSSCHPLDINNTRVTIGYDGVLRYFKRENQADPFSLKWSEPKDFCRSSNPCGNFGICDNRSIVVPCKCPPSFDPNLNGCTRKPGSSDNYQFLSLKMMRTGKPDDQSNMEKEVDCSNKCINTPRCEAYSFIQYEVTERGTGKNCWMWLNELNNIQEDIDPGIDLNIRIKLADIGLLKRSCKTCGSVVVPYPLSTSADCGDPSYSNFTCDDSTGRLHFHLLNSAYRVIRVDQQALNFTIQLMNLNCSDGLSNISTAFSDYSQFHIGQCKDTQNASSTTELLTEIDILWKLPGSEPACSSSIDCQDWPQTTCNTTPNGTKRCLCISNLKWNHTALNCTERTDNSIPLLGNGAGNKQLYLISLIAIPIIIVSVVCFYYQRRKSSHKQVKKEQANLVARFYDSERRVKEFISSSEFGEDDKKDIDVPFIDLEVILEATGSFSDENKLGQGGFGPVYKGKFPGGQEIAVKRLSSASGQGLGEFKNEVMLIAKLQHRNLVRLLGYCVDGEEKMLLYEYMPNKSLDSFLFDQTRCKLLTWEMRLEIILGIARGMLYLHQDSRLRIIHRDLKTSNILLDEEMNPKISDFGMARIFQGKQTEATTQRVIGTYGYMSPEYALDGFFSFKSDVFSFGVIVLEIISGKRNTGIYLPEGKLNLVNHAWTLWTENRVMDLMDRALEGSCNKQEVLKCVNVGLLCVQEDPSDRPAMSNVLFMLGGDIATLPIPKKPAFALQPTPSTTGSSSTKHDSAQTLSSTIDHSK
ncbi:hypothetical protein SAY87_030731 [Trapa incisa]|uniref:non-specific serine/threonine protein kinase n=1 Tax=Trapa incisa TaxID=236973 RepID=A0AAN7KQ04_9MYRT|nr:hypothetical protein SAY87_030731 [Trapa incisa]